MRLGTRYVDVGRETMLTNFQILIRGTAILGFSFVFKQITSKESTLKYFRIVTFLSCVTVPQLTF